MATPIFAIWNSPGMFLVNVAVAVVLNLPCWVVARSTRGRVEALLTRVGGGAFIEPSADE